MSDRFAQEIVLLMENKLGIRVGGINFSENGRNNASVHFELYSSGHQVGSPTRTLVNFTQEVPNYPTKDGFPEYLQIVSTAAAKLEEDFQEIVKVLSTLRTANGLDSGARSS